MKYHELYYEYVPVHANFRTMKCKRDELTL
jgi:hypothetical protein